MSDCGDERWAGVGFGLDRPISLFDGADSSATKVGFARILATGCAKIGLQLKSRDFTEEIHESVQDGMTRDTLGMDADTLGMEPDTPGMASGTIKMAPDTDGIAPDARGMALEAVGMAHYVG